MDMATLLFGLKLAIESGIYKALGKLVMGANK